MEGDPDEIITGCFLWIGLSSEYVERIDRVLVVHEVGCRRVGYVYECLCPFYQFLLSFLSFQSLLAFYIPEISNNFI